MSAPSSAAPGECADGDGARGFVDLLARERREFNLPSRLRETAERFAADVLALLFPHFGAGAGTSAGDVAAEHAALRRLLVEALALPGSHASEREAIADRFLAELPAIREALLLDARGRLRGRSRRTQRRRGHPRLPGLLRHRDLPGRPRAAHARGAALPAPADGARPPARPASTSTRAPRIGPRFFIDHGTGVVIGETAVDRRRA